MKPEDIDPKDAQQLAHFDAEARARVDELKRRAAGLEREIEIYIEGAEAEAGARVAAIIAQAEREAEEIRADARTTIEQARERVNELMRLRQALFATLRGTLSDFERAVTQAEEERTFADEAADVQIEGFEPAAGDAEEAPSAGEEAAEGAAERPAGGEPPLKPVEPGPVEPGPAEPEPDREPEETELGPSVRVEVGPLRDFEAASAIERALSSLPATRGVSLHSFEDGTAVLQAFGVTVNTLLTSMRSSFSIPFILRNADARRLVLQVDEPEPHGEG